MSFSNETKRNKNETKKQKKIPKNFKLGKKKKKKRIVKGPITTLKNSYIILYTYAIEFQDNFK